MLLREVGSRSGGREPLTDQLDGFGQRTWAEAEGALDQARLANDVAREVEDRRLTFAKHFDRAPTYTRPGWWLATTTFSSDHPNERRRNAPAQMSPSRPRPLPSSIRLEGSGTAGAAGPIWSVKLSACGPLPQVHS